MSVRTRRPPALTFGQYQLLEPLRGPSLTERHRALAPDGRYVVLHIVRPELARDFAFRSLFQVQAAKARALTHPNLARIIDFGEAQGRWYLAVEEVAGEDLATRLAAMRARGERFARRDVRAIVHDVAAGLAYAHEQGVVHGDVRSGNVVLSSSGPAVLTGFVIARSLRTDDRIAVGAFAPAYMAPEQSEGKPPDQRSDIYALGVLTYELLAGRPPYVAETPLAVLLAHGREPLPLPSHVEPSIGAPLERVLLRALAVDPSARHPDARSFAASLDEAFEEDARRAATSFVPAVADRRAGRASAAAIASTRSPLAIGLAAALFLVGTIAGGLLRPLIEPTPDPTIAVASPVTRPTPPLTPVPTVGGTPPTAVTPPVPRSTPPPPPPAPALLPLTPGSRAAVAFGPKGETLFEARLDGSRQLEGIHLFSGGPGAAAIREAPGAIDLEVSASRGGVEAFFPVSARNAYIGEFVVVVPSGSELMLTWGLRRDGEAAYLLRLDAAAETLALLYDDGVRLRETLSPRLNVTALRTGRRVPISFKLGGPELSFSVDAQLVSVRDTRITRATLAPDIFVGEEGGMGSARIVAARLYEIVASAPPPPGPPPPPAIATPAPSRP